MLVILDCVQFVMLFWVETDLKLPTYRAIKPTELQYSRPEHRESTSGLDLSQLC
jgi:hypothetical protein